MKLISDIINELVDSEKSLTAPLLKTKVLASRLKNTELLNWVNRELSGYESEEELPSYRKFQGSITGIYVSGNYQYNDQPLATIGLPEQLEKSIKDMDFYQGVTSLESFQKENQSGRLEKTIPAELTALMARNIQKMGNPFFNIISAKSTISINSVTQVLEKIRSKLLDFMLKIDEEFGSITEIEELKEKNKQISTIMNQTIINQGDGNVINTGENSVVKAKIEIKKGDKKALEVKLKQNGLTDSDIIPLLEVIDNEEPNLENHTFGKPVNSWVQKMLGKTLEGSWTIGTGAAGTLLAEAIKAYYGM